MNGLSILLLWCFSGICWVLGFCFSMYMCGLRLHDQGIHFVVPILVIVFSTLAPILVLLGFVVVQLLDTPSQNERTQAMVVELVRRSEPVRHYYSNIVGGIVDGRGHSQSRFD
jgi:uncharacterized membrane protein